MIQILPYLDYLRKKTYQKIQKRAVYIAILANGKYRYYNTIYWMSRVEDDHEQSD